MPAAPRAAVQRLIAGLAMLVALLAWSPLAAAQGCAMGEPGQTATVPIGDTGRPMLLHLPSGFDGEGAAPLVFLLHGSGGTGAAMLRDSKLAATADAHGFVLAAPDAGIAAGNGFVWNIPGVPTVTGAVPGPGDPDDVAYIRTAIRYLADRGCIDPARVYVTGLSGGGRMTSWLGCVADDRIAAIAPVVGLRAGNPNATDTSRPDPATCRPDEPMPVMAFAGDEDETNPIAGGGAGYWQYSMHAAEQRWAQLNHCAAAPSTRWVRAGVYEERYTDCRGDADVIGRISVGKGHSWVADNEAMWAFFSAYRRDGSDGS
ncbi:alpha/beta hydrolase family esterase [Stakelama saccharophila]|uniref:PHB depolymerase family esterase n=1 Tax=Stakelama saccharophila TaxID=3075605 RepID=A0ABZ0BD11_9SPHN|nr:PHB depolymerase family esterase [Stakelama sp. W311]WNO54174.1 PHB depolymerase family esterase [Stakelama sp. W311]